MATLRMTHTTVSLPVSDVAYREIRAALTEAGYQHCFIEGRIDMTGIALVNGEHPCVCKTHGKYNCELSGVDQHN